MTEEQLEMMQAYMRSKQDSAPADERLECEKIQRTEPITKESDVSKINKVESIFSDSTVEEKPSQDTQ